MTIRFISDASVRGINKNYGRFSITGKAKKVNLPTGLKGWQRRGIMEKHRARSEKDGKR